MIAPDADVAQLRKHSSKVCSVRSNLVAANLRGTVNKVWSLRKEVLVTFSLSRLSYEQLPSCRVDLLLRAETHLDPSIVTGRRSDNANAVPLRVPNPQGEGRGHSLYSSQHRHVICKTVKPYCTKMLESLVF